MSSVTRILKTNDELAAWDEFVDENATGTIFHKTNWLKLINAEIEIITIWEEEKIKAGVALIKTVKNGVAGFHIPPYTQYFSPLFAKTKDQKHSLTEEHESIKLLLEKIKEARHIDFKLPRGHQSILPYHWMGFESSVGITHIITGKLENYLADLNKNKARELKKLLAMENDGEISIEESVTESELLQLLQHTGERKKFDAKATLAASLVLNSDNSFAKKYLIRSKQHGLIAFGFFPYDKHAVYNLINASIRVSDPVLKTINLLLLYKAIEFALNSGRTFDFEGSMLQGVEAFCRLMGGAQAPVYRVQKSSSLRYSILRAANQIKNDRRKT
ncbi:hypothetical protein BH11BAC4_BH11BAC4_11620 [soil metagenome]